MTGALSIRLMILSGPPQRGQIRGSASYTFLISRAQERRNRDVAPPIRAHQAPWRAPRRHNERARGARSRTRRNIDYVTRNIIDIMLRIDLCEVAPPKVLKQRLASSIAQHKNRRISRKTKHHRQGEDRQR